MTTSVRFTLAGRCPVSLVNHDGNTSPASRFAARELQKHLRKASGRRLPVARDNISGPRIHIGTVAAIRPAAPPKLIRRVAAARPESFGWLATPEDLWLTGRDPRGLLHGVYALLNRGCGFLWLDPDRGGTVTPHVTDITLPKGVHVEEPAFAWRGIGDGCALEYSVADIDWMSRNRLNLVVAGVPYWNRMGTTLLPEIRKRAMRVYVGGHFGHHFFPDPKRYATSHPEYYALIDGRRDVSQICYSNADACRIHIDNMLAYVDAHPGIDIFGLWANDGSRFCQCPACRRTGQKKLMYDVYIRLADAVADVNPRVKIEYGYYLEQMFPLPRGIRFPDNLMLMYAPYSNSQMQRPVYDAEGRHPVSQERSHTKLCRDLHTLRRNTPNILMFTYYTDQIMKAGTYRPTPHVMQEDMRYYHDAGVAGFHDCFIWRNSWWLESLNLYVHARMLWDPWQDMDTVLRDYYTGIYGQAATDMAEADRLLVDLSVTTLYHGRSVWETTRLATYFGMMARDMGARYRPGLADASRDKVTRGLGDVRNSLAAAAGRPGSPRRRIRNIMLAVDEFETRVLVGLAGVKTACALKRFRAAPASTRKAARRAARNAMSEARAAHRTWEKHLLRLSKRFTVPAFKRLRKASQSVLQAQRDMYGESARQRAFNKK